MQAKQLVRKIMPHRTNKLATKIVSMDHLLKLMDANQKTELMKIRQLFQRLKRNWHFRTYGRLPGLSSQMEQMHKWINSLEGEETTCNFKVSLNSIFVSAGHEICKEKYFFTALTALKAVLPSMHAPTYTITQTKRTTQPVSSLTCIFIHLILE